MIDFFRNLVFNQISFIIGFVAGALAFWLITKLRPALPGLIQNFRTQSRKGGTRLLSGNAARLQQDTLRHIQSLHLASSLFALDEILIEPRILARPVPDEPGQEHHVETVLEMILPYLPDWPELAARYSAKTYSLAEALSGGANLVLSGNPGAGKTIALAHLISQVVRKDPAAGDLTRYLPLYIHIAELSLDQGSDQTPLESICASIQPYATSLKGNRLENVLRQSFQSGRVLLLLDGLDEADTDDHSAATRFLSGLLEQYPQLRLVVSASPENHAGFTALGFVSVAIAAWNEHQYLAFIHKWSRSWFRHIRPMLEESQDQIDPRLLNAWQLAENPVINPLDATLKAWAIFAGDIVGPGYLDAIESYIWRMTNHLKDARQGLEDFALQMVAAQQVAMDLKEARGFKPELEFNVESDQEHLAAQKNITQRGKRSTRKLPGFLPALLDNGLLVERRADRLSFSHPVILAYLASAALADAPVSHFLSSQGAWSGKSLTLLFLSACSEQSPEINELLYDDSDPLLRGPLTIGRWLHYAPLDAPWRSKVMRYLATELQRGNIPAGLRARLLSALLVSGDPGVGVLLRQISHTSSDDLRKLSALGMGFLLDQQSLIRLSELLDEPDNQVSLAACYALAVIGNQQALELLGTALLHGRDEIRRTAAEALALDPGEGHEMLKEASQMDDLMVRRAAAYGLARLSQPWADEVLNQLALEDDEWVVRSAATQIIEQREEPDACIPRKPQPLHEVPWLVAFASQRGIGIAPGQPAQNLLLTALAEGTPEQQQAALDTLQTYPNPDALVLIHEYIAYGSSPLQQAAYNALFSYAVQGLNIKNPAVV